MLRRRRARPGSDAAFGAFRAVLDEVEPAKAALTQVMPTTRLPGRQLPDAVMEFEERLGRSLDLMPGWRPAAAEAGSEVWAGCERGLREALDRARKLREEPPELAGFEGLIWAVEQLMRPLEAFEGAAEHFRGHRG